MKFVDLSGENPVEVEVFDVQQLAHKMNVVDNSGSYHRRSILQNWVDSPEIATPTPAFTFQETPYWKPEQVTEWEALWEREIGKEEERKAKILAEQKISFSDMLDILIKECERVERRNSHCYSHNRSNTMSDGRKRVMELIGARDFLTELITTHGGEIPRETSKKISELISAAKQHVKMQ